MGPLLLYLPLNYQDESDREKCWRERALEGEKNRKCAYRKGLPVSPARWGGARGGPRHFPENARRKNLEIVVDV